MSSEETADRVDPVGVRPGEVPDPRQGQPTLGRIAFANSRADTFLGTRYRRLARCRGKQKAIVATGNSVLTVVYHLLSDPDAKFCDLG